MSKKKKSEIQYRARRLIDAFSSEARKQALMREQKKLIRAQYEKGQLHLKEDILTLTHVPVHTANGCSSLAERSNTPTRTVQILLHRELGKTASESFSTKTESSPKEKLRFVMNEIVQMYSLQFKIVDDLLGILKNELQKF